MSREPERAGARLLAALEAYHQRGLRVGDEFRDVIYAGDLEVEIAVRVRARQPGAVIVEQRAAALAYLGQHLQEAQGCAVYTKPRGPFGHFGSGKQCKAKITAAVVYLDPPPDAPSYHFVCGRHREKHGIDPRRVLAVVELPYSTVEQMRQRAAVELERQRIERAAREHAAGEHRYVSTHRCVACDALIKKYGGYEGAEAAYAQGER